MVARLALALLLTTAVARAQHPDDAFVGQKAPELKAGDAWINTAPLKLFQLQRCGVDPGVTGFQFRRLLTNESVIRMLCPRHRRGEQQCECQPGDHVRPLNLRMPVFCHNSAVWSNPCYCLLL